MGASAKPIDFSGVKDRGDFNPRRVAEGDYAATVTKVEDGKVKTGDNAGDFMYIFTIKLDRFSQNTYPYRCKTTDSQLWKLRNIAVAAGLNVPKKRQKFDPNRVVGKRVGVTLEDDEYEKNGKTIEKSEVGAVFPISELADGPEMEDDDGSEEEFEAGAPVSATDDEFDPEDEAGEDKPKKKKKKGKKAKAEEPAAEEPKKKGKKKGKKKNKGDIEELDISDV